MLAQSGVTLAGSKRRWKGWAPTRPDSSKTSALYKSCTYLLTYAMTLLSMRKSSSSSSASTNKITRNLWMIYLREFSEKEAILHQHSIRFEGRGDTDSDPGFFFVYLHFGCYKSTLMSPISVLCIGCEIKHTPKEGWDCRSVFQGCGVGVGIPRSPPESGFSLLSETATTGTYTSWMYTVLRGFGRCTVLAGHVTSSMSCHHATLFACTPCTFYYKNLEFLSSHP